MAQPVLNGGLDSLAHQASRHLESQGEGPSVEANASKSSSQISAQKGKVRKAYTITKQRERWTDSEHDRFLQALKRYGRAWRKIEEHIGTKTAVQIRSHAQKFFSKLQREQSANGGTGEESSKACISIPPPRPKRKPAHPYPRKTNDSTTENASLRQQPQQHQASGSAQPSAAPSDVQLPAYPKLDTRGGEPSLSQVLEAAAMAAASAWSQVVASAGSKVQHQLQAHVAAQSGLQGMQALFGAKPALLYQMAPQQQHQTPVSMAANLQSSSQHPMGRSAFVNAGIPDSSLTGTSTGPHMQRQAQSMQDSPDGAGNAADQGNDRDSACSKEYSRGKSLPTLEQAALFNKQMMPSSWQAQSAPPPEARLGRAAWEMMTKAQAATGSHLANPLPIATLARHPSRAFSAGPILHMGGITEQARHEPTRVSSEASEPGLAQHGSARQTSQTRSDTSQLAHYYQQAAAEEQQAVQEAENGSSGDGDGSSGEGEKVGLPCSDKGSNTGNSGSDEDGNGNGSRSDNGASDPTDGNDVNGNEGKGSDEGSNSPSTCARNGTPPAHPSKPVQLSMKPQKSGLFSFGSGIDPARLTAASAQLQHQKKHPQQASAQGLPHQALQAGYVPQALLAHQQALAAYQQQALAAWATSPQPQAPNCQLIQGLLNNLQHHGSQKTPAVASAPPAVVVAESSLMDRKSSGVPSMDTFNATSTRSYSMPTGVTTGSEGCGGIPNAPQEAGEHANGFQPYNKRHGMPVTSLPPSKRFAATAGDKPKPAPVPATTYSPFRTLLQNSKSQPAN